MNKNAIFCPSLFLRRARVVLQSPFTSRGTHTAVAAATEETKVDANVSSEDKAKGKGREAAAQASLSGQAPSVSSAEC